MKPDEITGKYDLVFWDFDGVIMDSMPVRDLGFVEVLKHYPAEQVDQLLDYHRQNGGLSRYHKFKYFYENIRGEECTDKMVADLSASFSVIMKQLLVNEELLISETVEFINQLQGKVSQIVVSGSDQTELRFLNKEMGLAPLFNGIFGSPTPKMELVKLILKLEQVKPQRACLIGDSINDWEAAEANNIGFGRFFTHEKQIEWTNKWT